jgi:hypothetical protein
LGHQVSGDAVDDELRAVEVRGVRGAVRPQERNGASGVSRGGVGDGVGADAFVRASQGEAAVYELHASVEGDVKHPLRCCNWDGTPKHEGGE